MVSLLNHFKPRGNGAIWQTVSRFEFIHGHEFKHRQNGVTRHKPAFDLTLAMIKRLQDQLIGFYRISKLTVGQIRQPVFNVLCISKCVFHETAVAHRRFKTQISTCEGFHYGIVSTN